MWYLIQRALPSGNVIGAGEEFKFTLIAEIDGG